MVECVYCEATPEECARCHVYLRGSKKPQKEAGDMPHYKNESVASVGDVLKTNDGRVGTVVDIHPGIATCNADVAVIRVCSPENVYSLANCMAISTSEGFRLVAPEIVKVTLGECEKIV